MSPRPPPPRSPPPPLSGSTPHRPPPGPARPRTAARPRPRPPRRRALRTPHLPPAAAATPKRSTSFSSHRPEHQNARASSKRQLRVGLLTRAHEYCDQPRETRVGACRRCLSAEPLGIARRGAAPIAHNRRNRASDKNLGQKQWWAWQDSNLHRKCYEHLALTVELHAPRAAFRLFPARGQDPGLRKRGWHGAAGYASRRALAPGERSTGIHPSHDVEKSLRTAPERHAFCCVPSLVG